MFPFPIAQPHGFTMDIIQQSGSSGSPVFYIDKPEVVGMMSSSLPDSEFVERHGQMVEHAQNTNISICVVAGSIRRALDTLEEKHPPQLTATISASAFPFAYSPKAVTGTHAVRVILPALVSLLPSG